MKLHHAARAARLMRASLLVCCLILPVAPGFAASLQVVATFSILADIARQVGGEGVVVRSLVGADEDAHGYQPRPSDARLVREADLFVANGLGFDSWAERLAAAAGHARPLVIASDGVSALESSHDHSHGHGHDHGDLDPHAWQNVANAKVYASNIAAALIAADPEGADGYRQRLADYHLVLDALDAEIRSTLSVLPPSARKIVTSHDAFAYFGRAYGMRFLAAAGLSQEAEPSAAGIARLVRQIRREEVAVVFLENVSDPRLLQRIANESGARVGGSLYSDALSGPNGPAPTYVEMMRHNLAIMMTGLRR